jgi:hypothetical protein
MHFVEGAREVFFPSVVALAAFGDSSNNERGTSETESRLDVI